MGTLKAGPRAEIWVGPYEPIYCSSKLLPPHLSILTKQCSHMTARIAGFLGKRQSPPFAQVSGIQGLPGEGTCAVRWSLSLSRVKQATVNTACSRGDPIMTLIGRRCSRSGAPSTYIPPRFPGSAALPTWNSPVGVPRVQHLASSAASTGIPAVSTCPFLPRKQCGITAGRRKELCCLWSEGQLVHYSWLWTTPLNMLPRSRVG